DRLVVGFLGAILALVSLLFIRPLGSFGFLFCAGSGVAMVAAAGFLPAKASDLLLKVLGVTSCLYAVLDLKAIIQGRLGPTSDPGRLATLTGVPALVWG